MTECIKCKKKIDSLTTFSDQRCLDCFERDYNKMSEVFLAQQDTEEIRKTQEEADFLAKGYFPITDITEDHHGKTALLCGKISNNWMTITKNNETVRLLCNENIKGYQRPRQRSRYFPAEENLYIKLTNN